MLPAANRMRRAAEFTSAVRGGSRAAGRCVVVHHRRGSDSSAPRVGLVVGRAVGASVVRHRVSRRLRAQLAARLDRLPAGTALVVRALPPSSTADSAALGAELDRALDRVLRR